MKSILDRSEADPSGSKALGRRTKEEKKPYEVIDACYVYRHVRVQPPRSIDARANFRAHRGAARERD